jgi:hypothetical protein
MGEHFGKIAANLEARKSDNGYIGNAMRRGQNANHRNLGLNVLMVGILE